MIIANFLIIISLYYLDIKNYLGSLGCDGGNGCEGLFDSFVSVVFFTGECGVGRCVGCLFSLPIGD
jgi:hypothetical protein